MLARLVNERSILQYIHSTFEVPGLTVKIVPSDIGVGLTENVAAVNSVSKNVTNARPVGQCPN